MTQFGSLRALRRAALVLMAALASAPAFAQGTVDTYKFKAVTEFSTNFWYTQYQKPYFETVLPKLSGGKLTANAVPFDQLGMTGFEMMKLLKIGTYDFAAGSLAYVTGDAPALEGPNLAGTLRNTKDFKAVTKAYFPSMAKLFEQRYNAKLVGIYPYPVSQIFCNMGKDKDRKDLSLADLKGKAIRSYGATVSDFIEGLGARPVILPFGEVVTGMQRGAIDCVATTTMTAYNTKFHQVSTHNFTVSANYALGYFAFNLDTWKKLTKESQDLIERTMGDMAEKLVERTDIDEADAAACFAAGPCKYGPPANLVIVKPSQKDLQLVADITRNTVLPRWVKRCGAAKCADDWNSFVGPVVGIKIAK